jgi:hypothetical protein
MQQMNPEVVSPSPPRRGRNTPGSERTGLEENTYSIASLFNDVASNFDDYEMLTHDVTSWVMDQPTHNVGVTPQAINDFSPINDIEMNEIMFGHDSAKGDIEETMSMEHRMIIEKFQDMDTDETRDADREPNLNDIFDIYFGMESLITQTFLQKLNVTYLEFLKLLSTISVMQAYRLSATLMYDKNTLLNKNIIEVSAMEYINNENEDKSFLNHFCFLSLSE